MIKAITLLYLPITVLGEHFYVTNSLSQLSQSVVESVPDVWTPPPFVDRELLKRELDASR